MKRWRFIVFSILALAIAGVLLWWSIRRVPLQEVMAALSGLVGWQIAVIFFLNSGIILLFAVRWWLILNRQGHKLPYLAVARYRLAAFSISYFTPGQHFGGEPLQIFLLHKQQRVPSSKALASVALDKAIELFANFTVVGAGVFILAASGMFENANLLGALPLSLLFLLLPATYLFSLSRGSRPLAKLLNQRPGLRETLISGEKELARLIEKSAILFLQCLGASVLVWGALFFEYWLMLFFLGLSVNGLQLLAIVVAGRIALLAPTPGALGALEASQVLAVQALGFDPSLGLALGLLIRARDVFFALIGLALGGTAGLSAYRRSSS